MKQAAQYLSQHQISLDDAENQKFINLIASSISGNGVKYLKSVTQNELVRYYVEAGDIYYESADLEHAVDFYNQIQQK